MSVTQFRLFDLRKSVLLATILILIISTVPLGSSRLSGLGNIETLSPQIDSRPGTFAFYYPWYSTPSGNYSWGAWNQAGQNPENVTDGKRDIAAADYPLDGVYDSANDTVIEEQIQEAKDAGIEGFIVSWWGINTITDYASMHIRNVCEKNNFLFMFYYEENRTVEDTEADIAYLLNNYANSTAYYKIDGRPVIYVYTRAVTGIGLNSEQDWNFHGYETNETLGTKPIWLLCEPVRNPPRYGVFAIEPNPDWPGYDGIGYIENTKPVFLQPNDSYVLKASISDIRNDSLTPGNSDVGFRVIITNGTDSRTLLNDTIVNFDDGWQDLSFDVSDYAGQNVTFRVESFAGGKETWDSEWAAVDYLYIQNSEGQIVSPDPFLDNGWKTLVENLNKTGYDPFLSMDFTGYQGQLQNFADYFLNFTDGLHVYTPIVISQLPSQVLKVYTEASNVAHSKNKLFTASVTPGFDNSAESARAQPLVIGRYNGTYYRASWSVAEACSPDGYVVTSFNEWLEGTEIEPSLQYGYQYINLTNNPPTVWNVDQSNSSGFTSIQEAIDAATPGDGVIVSPGIYNGSQINVTKSVALIAEGTELDVEGGGAAVQVTAENVAVDGFAIKNVSTATWGIKARGASNFLIMGITMQNNSASGGIRLDGCEEASLQSNLLLDSNQAEAGIELNASRSILVRDNTCNSTSNGCGIEVENSYNNSIYQNFFAKNLFGIELQNSSDTYISTNIVAENSQDGILLNGGSSNGIVGNDIINNLNGISMNLTSDNEMTENNVLKSNSSGISLNSSSRNNVTSNEVTVNQNGFWMALSSENLIENNTIITNTFYGVLLDSSANNTLSENLLSNDNVSLALDSSSYNIISGNTVTANSGSGIFLHSSLNNTMFANNETNNSYGLILESSANNNSIFENDLNNNSYALGLTNSSDNQFYHNNFVNNTMVENGTSLNSLNTWDNGYSSGGNYWNSETGVDQLSGPNQNETGPDWILDSPVVIDQKNLDRYPLEYPFTTETEEIRIAYRSLLVKYDTAQLQTQILNSSVNSIMTDLANLQAEIDSANQNIIATQDQLTRAQATINNLTQSLNNVTQQIGHQQEQISSLNNQVNSLTIAVYVSIALAAVLGASALYLAKKNPRQNPKMSGTEAQIERAKKT